MDMWYQTGAYQDISFEEVDSLEQRWDAGYHSMPSPIMIEQEGGMLEVHHDNSGSLKLVGPSEFEYDGVWDG